MDLDADYMDSYDDESVVYDDLLEEDQIYGVDDNSPFQEGVTIFEVYEHCIEPTMAGALNQVWFPVLMCLLFRFTTRFIPMPILFCHYCSLICGVGCLTHMMGNQAVFTLIVAGSTFSYITISARKPFERSFRGVIIMCLIYLVTREYVSLKAVTESWEQVRGIQMIMCLKLISLSYDLVSRIYTDDLVPSRVEYLGYIFCPATFLFGPWVSYADYLSIFDRNKPMLLEFVKQVPRLLLCSFVCLAYSSCGVYWVFLGFNSTWMTVVRDAMSVRFSHYFISFLSEAMCLIVGLTSDNGKSRIQVVDILNIEFPRSLSEVVVSWNKPMHFWLKKHAYIPASYLGATKAVLITFIISAMLHGLNFQLSCVLLSLGVYCYVEHSMRESLAIIFNACIKSRRCSPGCKHEYKGGHVLVILTNFVLSCLAYFHLSYLGVMMDTNTTSENSSGLIETVVNRLGRWNSVGYSSHWIVLLTFLTMYLI